MRESYVEPSLPIQQTLTVHSYSGDLTFTFQNELQIRIPNHQLVLPDITIDTSGNTNYNYSVREIMLNSDQQINANDMPFLGATFLTSAYLSVNHDYGSFSLWQANPTTDEKLIGIGPNGNGCQETANATSSTSPIATASQSSQPQPHPSPHISGGAIAGIVVVALVVAGLVAGCIFMRLRRRNRQQRIEAMNAGYHMGRPSEGQQGRSTEWYDKAELPGDQYRGSYSDRNLGNVAPGSSAVEVTKHHFRDACLDPQELDAS
jgi:hypothetical protein